MSRAKFNKCPECGIGTMRPTGGAATITDPDTGTDTRDYQEYQCDNCGYPRGVKAKADTVNEQLGIGGSPTNGANKNSSGGSSDSDIKSKDNQPF